MITLTYAGVAGSILLMRSVGLGLVWLMAQIKTEAVVLRGVDFSESSRIVTFLTPERGRVACIAKGARRQKSALGPVLDTFNRVDMVYYYRQGRQVQTLAEAALLDGFLGFKGDLGLGVFAAVPLEIATNLAREDDPSEALYGALVMGLEQMAGWSGDPRTHACWQVFRLFAAAGFEPELDVCVRCGETVADGMGFALEGGVARSACPSDVRLPAAVLAEFRSLRDAEQSCPFPEIPAAGFRLLVRYAEYHLERGLRSVRVAEETMA